MSADTILTVTDLHFAVGRTRILNGIDFSVPRGQTLGIIGPNGSGKTTLFNCISGFNVQQQGSIVYAGQDLGGMLPHQRARAGLGRVFQNFGVFRDMTVSENIVTGLETRGGWWSSFLPWSKATAAHRAKALEYLEEVGLGAKAEEKASSLSGGQMRLLEIIRTLAFGAELFLLDEPTAGVSPKMKEEVGALIAKLRKLQQTVLVIEHDINFIQRFCDRVIVLDQGRVVLDGSPEQVRADPALEEIYFGTAENAAQG